jgi:hypothetical protein
MGPPRWGLFAMLAFQYGQGMPEITPAQLSLELSVDQRRIRDALRSRYSTLPTGVTRWRLTHEQADDVRAQFHGGTVPQRVAWTLEPGDTVLRRELHAAYGGSQQNGIVTLKSLPDIIAFTDPKSGEAFGYGLFEGLQPDGSYHYTGEGQQGDQEFVRGNRAIRDSSENERPIRLFTAQGTSVTYVGEFATGTPTYWERSIPGRDAVPRKGIIFNLVPVEADVSVLARTLPAHASPAVTTWSPPDASDVVIAGQASETTSDRSVSRLEFALQADFGEWLKAQGHEPKRLRLPCNGTIIEPDLFAESRGWIVEAKKSTAREYVREAIGQVLDYVHVAERFRIIAIPVILLPGRPSTDLVELLHRHGITLAIRDGDGFEVLSPPR